MNNKTLDYYNQNAKEFVAGTVAVDFNEIQDRFVEKLSGKNVLDFGCGSGRDTKYFLQAGLHVTAIDGSEEMCRCASEYTGIKVQHMLFQELNEKNTYDGIWACASILIKRSAVSGDFKDGGCIANGWHHIYFIQIWGF